MRAASFINGRHRSEGDFSHAYGADGWKNQLRAETYLNSIPKGTFIDGLSIEVMQEVNRLIHAPDTGMKAKMLRSLAYVGRGFKWDVGGEIRDGKQYARPEQYSDTEIENLHEAETLLERVRMPPQRPPRAAGPAERMFHIPKRPAP